jgi:hydroxymethylpyrimidine/phosphomethylpyrimidine kinase
MPVALTIAGSDSGGGAGIQADLKTFTMLGVYGASVLTSITAQNTLGVQGIHDLPPEFVALQIDSVMSDIGANACKTGMLSNAGIVAAVADGIRRHGVRNLVVDPVMVAKGGERLLRPDAEEALIERLLPLALIVTPNIPEAEVLWGRPIESDEDARDAAQAIAGLGPRIVVVKGGHRAGDAVDLLFDGSGFEELSAPRVDTRNTHGTGCTFSAAIAAQLAKGDDVASAVRAAKAAVTAAIRASLDLGAGHGPTNHMAIGR